MLKLWLWALAAFALSMFLCHGFKPSFLASVEQRNIEAAVASFIIPETNLYNWSAYSGATIQTGRLTNSHIEPGSYAASTINNALNACPVGGSVLLKNGDHIISSGTINLWSYSGRTLAGESTNATIRFQGGARFNGGLDELGNGNVNFGGITNGITSTLTYGTTNATCVATVTDLVPGSRVMITQSNDWRLAHEADWESGTNAQYNGNADDNDTPDGHWVVGQLVRILSVSGADITWEKPLRHPFTNANRRISYPLANNSWGGVGLENLTIYQSTSDSYQTLYVAAATNFWITNCVFYGFHSQGESIRIAGSYGVTISGCDFRRGTNNVPSIEGITTWINNEGTLVENCAFEPMHHAVQFSQRGGGHAAVNNYIGGFSNTPGSSTFLKQVFSQHGAGVGYTLFEGNEVVGKLHLDNINGSTFHNVLYRNRIHGTFTNDGGTTGGEGCIAVDVSTVHSAIVGNHLGTNSGMSTDGWAYARSGDVVGESSRKGIFMLGFSGFASVTNAPTPPFVKAVEGHTLRAGNYHYVSNAVDATWTGTKSNGIFYTSKPSYFGNLPWPSYGEDVAGGIAASKTNELPAKLRLEGRAIP